MTSIAPRAESQSSPAPWYRPCVRISLVLLCSLPLLLFAGPPGNGQPVLTDTPLPPVLELAELWDGGLVLHLELQGLSAAPVRRGRDTYHRLDIPGTSTLSACGRPRLPAVARYIAVPEGATVDVAVQGNELELPGLVPLPFDQPGAEGEARPDPAVYGGGAIYPASRAEVGTVRRVHGCRMALLKLYPVRYDASRRALSYTPRMRVTVRFAGGNGRFIDERHRSPGFDRFFRALLVNAASLGTAAADRTLPACEMLIITPETFRDEAIRLARWKNRRGIPTLVRTTEEICEDEEEPDEEEISTWIQQRYDTDWPQLSYLLIFGDVGAAGSIPCHYGTLNEEDGMDVATDLYYGVVDVEQGDLDYFPDLFIGRIPVDDATNAGDVVDKILAYEQAPHLGGWLDSILITAQYDTSRYYIETSNTLFDYLDDPDRYQCTRVYSNSGGTTDVLEALNNNGAFLVTHRGHGQDRNRGDLHSGWMAPAFDERHIDQLDNGPFPPVLFSINCRTGWFDGETDPNPGVSDSLCELLLRHCPGGVVGAIGDTRTTQSGYNDELIKGFIDAIWEDFAPFYPLGGDVNPLPSPLYQMGAVLNFGKFWMYDKYILDEGHGYEDLPGWEPPSETWNRIHFEACHYFGDPSMEIWTGTPEGALVVLHNDVAFIGDTSFSVDVEQDDALAAVSMDGMLLGRAVSSGGQATVLFDEPLSEPGELEVCVTKHGLLPYIGGTVEVRPPDGPWLLHVDHEVDDTPTGGNGDGLVSPGEELDLHIALHNFGNTTATGVTAELTSESEMAEVLPEAVTYPDVAAYETAWGSGPFRVQVRHDCPDREVIHFTVTTHAGADSWQSSFFIVVDAAQVEYYRHQVLDSLPGGGNRDYIADPGELFELRVSLRNQSLVYASQITAGLTSSEPLADIRVDEAGFPNISPGNTGTSFSPHFRVALDETIPCGTRVPFNLLVITAEGQCSIDFEMLVGSGEVVFEDGMEQGPGQWTTVLDHGDVDWSIVVGQPPGNYGHAWYSPGEGAVKDNWLVSPVFPVTRSSSLRFMHRVVMEAGFEGWGFDGCVLEITTDDGGSWTDLGPYITQGPYTHVISTEYESPIADRPAWSGTSGSNLSLVEVDLDAFAGQDASLRFRLACDRSTAIDDSAWHIDEVAVLGAACHPWVTPDETISLDLVCSPPSGTLPFDVSVFTTIHNTSPRKRRVAASLDLQLAGGYFMADIASGSKGIRAGESFTWEVGRIFPGHPLLVGTNTFRVTAFDITESPFNQPPYYPASGDTAAGSCDVECLIP